VASGTVFLGFMYDDDLSFRYIGIRTQDGTQIKEFYVLPADGIVNGAKVNQGQVIGTLQSLQKKYPAITDHVHVEAMRNGALLDPTLRIVGR